MKDKEFLIKALIEKGFAKQRRKAERLANLRPKDFRKETGTTKAKVRSLKRQSDNYKTARKGGLDPQEAKRLSGRSRESVKLRTKYHEDKKRIKSKIKREDIKKKEEQWSKWSEKDEKEMPRGIKKTAHLINGAVGVDKNHSYGFAVMHRWHTRGGNIKKIMKKFFPSDRNKDFYTDTADLTDKAQKKWRDKIDFILGNEKNLESKEPLNRLTRPTLRQKKILAEA